MREIEHSIFLALLITNSITTFLCLYIGSPYDKYLNY